MSSQDYYIDGLGTAGSQKNYSLKKKKGIVCTSVLISKGLLIVLDFWTETPMNRNRQAKIQNDFLSRHMSDLVNVRSYLENVI